MIIIGVGRATPSGVEGAGVPLFENERLNESAWCRYGWFQPMAITTKRKMTEVNSRMFER
jgi:hypothetical protein